MIEPRGGRTQDPGPLHPATRLGRSLQQIRSFAEMHARELEDVAAEAEATGMGEVAQRLRLFRELHAQETQLVLDELADVRADLLGEESAPLRPEPSEAGAARVASANAAASSPKRARWLAEQERAREPRALTRRALLRRDESS